MLAPTPLLRPSPMDLGGIFSGAMTALRRRFGLFFLLGLLPMLVAVVVVGIGVALIMAAVFEVARSRTFAVVPIGMIAGGAAILLGSLLSSLVQLKCTALVVQAAYEVAQGLTPDLRGLLNRTRGFLPRMLPVIGIGILAVIVAYGLLFGLFVGTVALNGDSGRASDDLAGMVLAMVLLFAMIPLIYFFSVKLLYTVPAVTIEQRNGFEAMKRSWQLTRGSFWRTFGYYLVGTLAVGAITYLAAILSELLLIPMFLGMPSVFPDDPDQMLAILGPMAPLLVVAGLVQIVVTALTAPFLQAYITYMYLDQVRRSEQPTGSYRPPAAPYGYYPQPPAEGYGPPFPPQATPGYGPGQPGYPPTAWPGPGPQQPGYPPGYPPNQGWAPPQQPYLPTPRPPQDGGWQPPQG
ncbi:MAG: glycerophosphoryl diester phosphodiesterase membrane domain-containing protein [Propionicimonas sp.]|nr:glycerophosphoryl diester phosphodiesterase membrane domain-containing protein [Propionicimonas sp.]